LIALHDAIGHYQAALARWPDSDHAGRAEIWVKLGQCQWVIMAIQEAHTSFETAHALFEALGERVKRGDMERMIGRMHWELGDAQTAWRYYWRALAILEEGPETVELARATSSISQMYMLASQYEETIAWGERAMALAERLGAEDVIVHVLNNVGTARMTVYDYDPDQGLAMLRESLRRAKALGLPQDAGRAYVNMGDCLLGLSRYAEARVNYEELLAYATPINARAFMGAAGLLITTIDWLQGRWADALASKVHIVPVLKGPWGVWADTRYAWIENDLGRPELACQILEPLLAKALQWDEMQTTVPYLGQLARAYAALGREAETAGVIRQSLDLIDRSQVSLHSDCIMPLLIACRWYAARPESLEAAQACLPRLERANQQFRSLESEAALAEGAGAVALARGDPLKAAGQFQQAARQWATMERSYDQARALGQLGRAWVEAGETSQASQAFTETLAIFDALAAQLDQPELREAFLNSPAVREVGKARTGLANK
jgi:tetratricopeptide (TPR) repeat protein